ncbi:MAG: type I-C CRISPR-associated protein Cas8c/Csd1, partial [Anaerolineales bacterium]|nr:type I-C CRISPR-associated protein Cas8c/Csd1 [Anaerolineales bacterium]
MILQSLYRYYQILCNDTEVDVAEPGYSNEPVSHILNLSFQGELLDILPLFTLVQVGKIAFEKPQRMNVPERVKRSVNVAANFMCDNAAYVLGLTGKEAKDPQYAQKRFEAFHRHNVEILSKTNSPVAQAIISFLNNHNPQSATEHPAITHQLEAITGGGNLVFQVEGKYALDDPKIKRAWEDHRLGQEAIEMQCLVTGEIEPISRLHPDIKGVRDAQTKGASLVSFNLDAFTSYGREKGTNSPISRRVASGYGVALNYLLSPQNPNRKIYLGDTTVVYWAESANKGYANAFAALIDPAFVEDAPVDDQSERREIEAQMAEVAGKVQKGQAVDVTGLPSDLDPSTRFFVLGLAPNAARLAVRFFLTEPFGKFVERIMVHFDDLKIQKEFANQPDFITPYRILAECVSPKVTRREEELKSSWGLLGGALMRSILTGVQYPEGLYSAIINRIRHDSDEEGRSRKINYPRAAFIKAHLLRKYRRRGHNPYLEVLQMSLNESFTHPAYVLGRLFAWLERAQREAIGDVNASIKDRYFTS